jgi:hypothetical protein
MSDKEDMQKLLEAMTPDQADRDRYVTGARSHIERRGIVPAPRDPGSVVLK